MGITHFSGVIDLMQKHHPALYNEVCHFFDGHVTVVKVSQERFPKADKPTKIKVIRRRNALTDF